jgi:sec-independent protein translocase protein TatC
MRKLSSAAEMPFLEHLEELRWRIIWSLAAVVIAVSVGFYLVLHFDLIKQLEAPILPYLHGRNIVGTHPTDGLQVTISASMWIGAVVSFPFVVYQAWLFLLPALYPRERSLLIAALLGGVVLFAVGAMFAYAVVIPLSLPWLFQFFGTTIDPMITVENYFGFVFGTVLTFGIAFELPVVVLLLSAAGLVTPAFLRRYRRHAFLLILVAGALLTPGSDITSTLALAGPLYLLFELSVFVAGFIWRRRKQGDAVAILLAPLLLLRRRQWSSAVARS